ncbi:MAG TPA: anti-sigma factor [Phototrophicaceae bacterium]|jgi:anti-sigma-K factor RskA|nr:anti-sigma factor [Phototrophicaceae bacterium]
MTNNTLSNAGSTDCKTVLELIPAYAIGATDPEETRFVERHLNDCPEAAAELQLYSELHDDLLFEAPLVVAPPRLAAKIAQIPKTEKVAGVQRVNFAPKTQKTNDKGVRNLTPVWVAVAAAAAVLILVNVYWIGQVNDLQGKQQNLQDTLDHQKLALQIANASDATLTHLISTEITNPVNSSGTVIWSPAQSLALLKVDGMPETPADQEYQLWLIKDEQRVSAGTFRVNTTGEGLLIFETSEPIQDFAVFGITLEPAGGSKEPTTSPVLSGEI